MDTIMKLKNGQHLNTEQMNSLTGGNTGGGGGDPEEMAPPPAIA